MKRFYVICAVIGVVLVGMTLYSRGEPARFLGIAETKETIINADESVEIERIIVVQGQKVSVGDTLVILDQPELTLMINEIFHTLDEFRAQHRFQASYSRSEMEKYKAEQVEKTGEITAEINELEAQYAMNNKLVDELRSVSKRKEAGDDSLNPILAQIHSLKRLRESLNNTPQVEINRLGSELASSDDPIIAQVRRYEEELALLNKRRKELVKIAQINGIIGMVKYRNGEKVAPFDTILTLHTPAPSYVKGFIHEDLFSRISVGDSVTVSSFVNGRTITNGQVTGVGTRIVEYPERLRKRIDLPIWGREVIVRVPEQSPLILGQKVLISQQEQRTFFSRTWKTALFSQAVAAEITTIQHDEDSSEAISDITIEPSLTPTPLEASGIIRLDDLKSFLVISDDTERKRPDLFLMDSTGRITLRAGINGLDNINDMESIVSSGSDRLYILASQSFNKKGKQSRHRTLLVRVKRKGCYFQLDESVPLFNLLLSAASANTKETWAQFILRSNNDKSVDVEGMAIFNDTLLLGFKNPKLENRAVLLAIADFDAMITTKKCAENQISLWRTLPLYDTTSGTFCGISDLSVHDGNMYGVSTGEFSQSGVDKDVGLLWKYFPEQDSLVILRKFTDIKPEGVTIFDDPPRYGIVFDNGTKNPSQFLIDRKPL